MAKRNPKEPSIKRVEAKEQIAAFASAPEQLEKVKLLLAMNGYQVEDLVPETHEYSTPAYRKPDVYKSPIEFSVNGSTIWLYGTRLVVDGKVYSVDTYSIPLTYKEIVKAVKNKSPEEKKSQEKPKSRPSETARYLAACTL